MSEFLKPQSPLRKGEAYIYPLTTADQVILENNSRLNAALEDIKDKIENINFDNIGGIDLSGYATKEDLNGFIREIPSEYVTESELNAKGYLTEHQNLSDYAKKSEIPDVSDFQTAEQVASLISEVRYSPILNLTTVTNTLSADMLGKTVMCRTAGQDFTLTITKEVHDALPIGFEVALVYWDTANSVKLAFTGGVYACIAGEGNIQNATLALPERFTMVAAKKVTSQSWLVTGNVEVV